MLRGGGCQCSTGQGIEVNHELKSAVFFGPSTTIQQFAR